MASSLKLVQKKLFGIVSYESVHEASKKLCQRGPKSLEQPSVIPSTDRFDTPSNLTEYTTPVSRSSSVGAVI